MLSVFTQRQLGITEGQRKKSTEKLSSGYRINRAADDAAGLTISEKMRSQIRGLTQASANVQDGVSLCQVADGYLTEVHDMMHRLNELAVKASNGTLQDEDRRSINEEVDDLKEEMRRIFNEANFNGIPLFHVPYTPEIKGYPNDMQVFHTGNGSVGGLEFNNVRYNISELQSKGMKIDDNGVATENIESFELKLYDGETAILSLKEGQSIEAVSRNYKWTADENGISINGKFAADWNEVRDKAGNGITDTEHIPVGTYTFSHHGMTISFDIEEEADLDDLYAGINGDLATKPASWDVAVGGGKSTNAADIYDTNSSRNATQTIQVTENNKSYIDGIFTVVADANGIAVQHNKNGVLTKTSYVSWNTFKDSRYASRTDENGNTVDTNGGYPVKNWGDVNDSNDSSSITFDADARYHFTSPDSNVKIEFDFSLAESASLDEVMQALNGATISRTGSGWGVIAPGGLTASGRSSVATITMGTNKKLANDFTLQRYYGRDFNNDSATLTANFGITRTTVDGQPSASDTPDAAGHTRTTGNIKKRELLSQNKTERTGDISYYVTKESVPKMEDGSQVVDDEGNPVYENVYHYYEYRKYDVTDLYENTYEAEDRWQQQIKYSIHGQLGSHSVDVEKNPKEDWHRSFLQTKRDKHEYTGAILNEVSVGDVPDEVKNDPDAYIASLPTSDLGTLKRISTDSVTYGDYTTVAGSWGTAELYGIHDKTYVIDFDDAFSITFDVDIPQAQELAKSSGRQSAGSVTFQANGYATRKFEPTENNANISEAQFNDVKLNVPKKNLNIQAGAHAGQHITMEWSPLNLTIIGISSADTSTQESALGALSMINRATDIISETRSTFGAYQNRFESTIRNLDNVVENTQAAESLLRDTDMSTEMVKNAKENILMQAGSAMLVQANQSRQGLLTLLQ